MEGGEIVKATIVAIASGRSRLEIPCWKEVLGGAAPKGPTK